MSLSIALRTLSDRLHVPEGVDLRVESCSWHTIGGPRQAVLKGTGGEEFLWRAVEWLGFGVVLSDDTLVERWWGQVTRVEVVIGPYTFGVALDSMANRIAVAYEEQTPGEEGAGERATTEWVQDDLSVAAYGIVEALLTLSSATREAAESYQASALKIGRLPVPTIAIADASDVGLTVECTGWWHTLGRRKGVNAPLGSKVEAGGEAVASLIPEIVGPIYGYAQRFTLAAATSLTALQVQLARVGATDQAVSIGLVSDAGGSLGTVLKVVTVPASSVGALGWVTATFDAPYDTTANSAYWVTAGITPAQLQTMQAQGATYQVQRATTQRGAELTTRVYQNGEWETTEGSMFFRALGAGAAVVAFLDPSGATQLSTVPQTFAPVTGYFQSFIALGAVPYRVGQIELKLGKRGTPPGPLLISLVRDSGNDLGAVIDTVPLQPAQVEEQVGWVAVRFGADITLVPGTRYWIAVTQAAAASFDRNNTYVIEHAKTSIALSGDFRRFQGGNALADGELYYTVGGLVQTTDLAANLIAAYGQFFTGVRVVAPSGVYSAGYEDGDSDAQTIIEELLGLGSTRALRLVATVDSARKVTVEDEPSSERPKYLIDRDGTVRTREGLPLPPGEVPVGQWARLKDVLPGGFNLSLIADPTLVFVEEAEYLVASGRWRPTPRGQRNVWDLEG